MTRRLFKTIVFLGVIAFIGLTGYAYFGDLSPEQAEVMKPVILNVDQ